MAERLPELVEKALELALGGDKALLAYCIDRVLGKTVQPIDITTQIDDIAAEYGVAPDRVVSIVERLRKQKAG